MKLRNRRAAALAGVVATGAVALGSTGIATGDVTSGMTAGTTAGSWTSLRAFRAPTASQFLPGHLLRSFAAPAFEVPIGVPVGSMGGYNFFLVPAKGEGVCLMGTAGSYGQAQAEGQDYGVCGSLASLEKSAIWVGRSVGRGSIVTGVLPDGYTAVKGGSLVEPVRNNVFMMRVASKVRYATATGAGMHSRRILVGGGMSPSAPHR
jgi:hypothetical protein